MARDRSRKWATHAEWCYERGLLPMRVLTRKLRTGRKTISAWDMGTRPVPHWAPQVLRLGRLEADSYLRQLRRSDPRNDTRARSGLVLLRSVAAVAPGARKDEHAQGGADSADVLREAL